MRQLILFGAGGYCKDVVSIVRDVGQHELMAVVDAEAFDRGARYICHIPIVRDETTLPLFDMGLDILVSIGSPRGRSMQTDAIYDLFTGEREPPWATLIHPSATIGVDVDVKKGCIIAAGARVMSDAIIHPFCVLNLNAVVGHDAELGTFCTLGPSCNALGGVTLGDYVDVGTGAAILPRVKVATGTIIGANAVVTKDITESYMTWVGVPARMGGPA